MDHAIDMIEKIANEIQSVNQVEVIFCHFQLGLNMHFFCLLPPLLHVYLTLQIFQEENKVNTYFLEDSYII